MGKVSGNWITGAHSGRACSKDNIYTKVNKKTGACYSVKLCHPNENWSESQKSSRKAFSVITSVIAAWIAANKVTTAVNYADYQKVLARYKAQSKYSSLHGFMIAKGMYTVASDGTVTVDVTANTEFKGVSASITGSNTGDTDSTPADGDNNSGDNNSGDSTPEEGGESFN